MSEHFRRMSSAELSLFKKAEVVWILQQNCLTVCVENNRRGQVRQ